MTASAPVAAAPAAERRAAVVRRRRPSFGRAALVALTFAPVLVVHPFRVRDYGNWLPLLATIGSGPYKLVEATETAYRMRANTDYFLGAPPIDELLFPVIKDQNTALQALRTGEIQGMTRELPPEQVAAFSQAPLKMAKGPGFASTLLQFNNQRAPFDKKEVRQAIDLAIDKQKLVDTGGRVERFERRYGRRGKKGTAK